MTTTSPVSTFSVPPTSQLEDLIVDAVVARLCRWIAQAQPGLCGRLDDLPAGLMARAAEQLHTQSANGTIPKANVRLLVTDQPMALWQCTWTEAVRLRNPDENRNKRPPLLLLVPPGMELLGSLDSDTFQSIPCEDVVRTLLSSKLRALPEALAPVVDVVRHKETTSIASETQRLRYLLGIERSGYSPEAAGLLLFLLGLWPHRKWLDTGVDRDYWLSLNRKVMASWREGSTSLLQRVYDLHLESQEQARRLYELISASPSVEAAAERVVNDSAWQDLDFGEWKFAIRPQTMVITMDPLDLPQHEDGYKVLRLGEQPNLPMAWSIQPSPAAVPSLTHYLVELISSSGESQDVAYTSESIQTGKSARKRYRLRGLQPLVSELQLPEGLYRARVTAWAGRTNITRQAGEGETPTNFSEYFWINSQGDEPVVLHPDEKYRTVTGYLEARREVQWSLLANSRDPWDLPEGSCSWDSLPDGKATQGVCTMQFGRQTFRLRVSNLLRRIEATILARPESLGALRAKLRHGAVPRDVELSTRSDMPALASQDRFLTARESLFAKIRGDSGQGLVETCDLLALRAEIQDYAREYARLLGDAEREVAQDPKRWPDRVALASIDTVQLTLPGLSEETSVAMLLAPTHPLRLLWQLQLALLGESWLREARVRGSAEALTPELRKALQRGLQPVNLPPVLFDRRRVGYLQAGQVSPGWDVFLLADVADKQSALSRLARALYCRANSSVEGVGAGDLADRVGKYLRQHPYIGQLQLNVFNPGDASVVRDMLLSADAAHPDLRYDVRLFCHDDVRGDLGSALDQLVDPEITVSDAAEKYSQAGRYPLHPNLAYSKNRIEDFLREPQRFRAHISLLVDLFRPRVEVDSPLRTRPGSGLFGLVQEEAIRCEGGQGNFAWERQVVAGPTTEIDEGAVEARLLADALAAVQSFVSALGASPSAGQGLVPTVRLDLSAGGQNLLYEIHRISDWVLTADRHLGIDYFDSAGGANEHASGAILLDFSPDFPSVDQAMLMLTTRIGDEIDQMVMPALERLGIDEPGCGPRVVEWLRSLSGRLAMRLLAAPMASQGVVGMGLARAFLDQVGLLKDTVVVPADAHVRLLERGIADDATKSRTDLLLARRVGTTRQIEFALVEVKCTAGLLTPAAYNGLRAQIVEQVSSTQAALTSLFDPRAQNPDRLDRPLRNLLLSRWLRFYVDRARRYRLLSDDAEQGLLDLLFDLEAGYTVSFRQVGLVFELGRQDDLEDGSGEVQIHRVGRPTCVRLLRGEAEPVVVPSSWDRIRRTIRGSEVWSRPSSDTPPPEDRSDDGSSPARPKPTSPSSGGDGAATGTEPATERAPQGEDAADGHLDNQPPDNVPACHYLVGDTRVTPQWGVIGRMGSDNVALDLNGCNTLSLFGVQGGGKSYTMGSILEMALRRLPGLNLLPKPLAAVVFHYNESQDYAPEFVTMARPNSVAAEVARLREEYGSEPAAIGDILVLALEDKVNARRQEFSGLVVEPIAFHPAELTIQDWRFLMGAVGNESLYIRELNLVMRTLRHNISLEALREGIENSQLSEAQRRLAGIRLRFAEQFVRTGPRLRDKLRPGRLVIVDLRDELIETDEALGLFVVMLRVFAGATHEGKAFNKWIAFDEAHKYIRNPDLIDSVVEVIRQMRHQATSVLIASQDPPSLPQKIIELSSLVMLHRMDSPAWLKHIQKAVTALSDLTAPSLARLRPGEAYLWARSATDPLFSHRAVKIECRPRATQHGGATKMATDG